MAQSGDLRMHCIGRFMLGVPQGWVESGRSQRMYVTSLKDDLPPTRFDVMTDEALLPVLRDNMALTLPLVKMFTLEGVGPAAWFGHQDSVNRQLSVLAGMPDAPFLMVAMATTGREEMAEEGLTRLATGYTPGARTGFCLTHGAMTLEPSRNEATSLTFINPAFPEASISFSTQTISKPRTDGPLMDISGDIKAMRGTGTVLVSLGERYRKVAGRKGHDGRTQMTEPGKEPVLIYRYFDGGVAGDQTSPEMIVSLDGPAVNRDELEAAWDAVLDSIRKVPLQ